MFPYFGRKARHAGKYPAPAFPLVIEPFAGSMAYTAHHRPQMGIGIEADSRVVDLWHRGVSMGLLGSTLVPPAQGSTTSDLLVKLASYSEHSLTSGDMKVSSRMLRDWDSVVRRMAEVGSWAADHVLYTLGDWKHAPNVEATWFIDPPYQYANRRGYKHGASGVDFAALAEFCKTRRGQVIVCEQQGADWLPFEPLYELGSHRGARSTEVVWMGGAR